MKRTLLTALWLSTAGLVAATPAMAQNSPDLDLSAGVWETIAYSNGWPVSLPLFNDASGGLAFDAPTNPNTNCIRNGKCYTINYLYSRHVPSSISGALVITLNVTNTGGSPIWWHDEKNTQCPGNPPTTRPFIWSHNNNYGDGDRWWAESYYYVLGPGTVTLIVPIDPANFSGVYGEHPGDTPQTMGWWEAAITNVSSLGITFGGGCNYGHGVFVTQGAAKFTIGNYDVVPNCPAVSPCPGLTTDCIKGAETGATSTGLNQCMTGDGSLLSCGAQSVNVVSTGCKKAACCSQTPGCLCPFTCPGGTYLECR